MPQILRDVDVSEISLVDSGANKKKRFYIIKRRILMNEEIKKLFTDLFEEDELEEINADLEILKSGDIEKAEKIATDAVKAIKDSLDTLNDYKEDMPPDVLTAFKTLTKYASYGYPIKKSDEDIDKAGAKLSKYTKDQITKALAIFKESPKGVDILKALLGQDVKKVDDKVTDEENISAETQAKLDELEKYKEKEKEDIEKAAEEKLAEKQKEIDDMKEDIELLKREKGIKTSIDEDPEKDKDKDPKKLKKGDEEVDPLPSIPTPVINRNDE